jgi:hypothetical protein
MAQEIVNRLVASVKVRHAPFTIVARSSSIANVIVNGVGDYSVELVNGGIGRSEAVVDCAIDGLLPAFITCLRVSATRWDVFTFDTAGDPADFAFCFGIHRANTGA